MFVPASIWFPAFVLTVAVEALVVWLLTRGLERDTLRTLALVLFANLATHPIILFVMTQLLIAGTTTFVVVAEGWAIGAEAVFYALVLRRPGPTGALATSIVANAASFAAGAAAAAVLPGWSR